MVVRKDKAVNDEVHEVLFVCFFFLLFIICFIYVVQFGLGEV